MIIVELTDKNWEIYSQLCELEAEFQFRTDDESQNDIIAKARELCKELEV